MENEWKVISNSKKFNIKIWIIHLLINIENDKFNIHDYFN